MTPDKYTAYFRRDIDRMDGYAPGEQLNVPELIKKYGGRITFMGDIDSATVDFEGWTEEIVEAQVRRACTECGKLYFIPNASQGLPMSTYPGVYEALNRAIDKMSAEMF